MTKEDNKPQSSSSPTVHSSNFEDMDSNNSDLDKIFKKRDQVVDRKIADEMLLVPIRGKLADMERIFSLNPVAEFIWGQLDGEKNLNEIRAGIQANFEVAEDQAGTDLLEFITELREADLIIQTLQTVD